MALKVIVLAVLNTVAVAELVPALKPAYAFPYGPVLPLTAVGIVTLQLEAPIHVTVVLAILLFVVSQ